MSSHVDAALVIALRRRDVEVAGSSIGVDLPRGGGRAGARGSGVRGRRACGAFRAADFAAAVRRGGGASSAGGRAELAANALEHRIAVRARVAEHADLDELVRHQVDVDLVQHRRREAVLADADDGMQVVRLRAKRAALGG